MTNKEWQNRVEILESLLDAKDKELAARDKEIEFLKARISKLEKQLGLDSSNSSKSPSSNGLRKKPYTQSATEERIPVVDKRDIKDTA